MELRRKFDEDPAAYDRYRPGYPQELFRDVAAYSGIRAGSRLLEIGIGTGQATAPFLQIGAVVTAAELGEELAAYAAKKFRTCENVRIVCGDYMELPFAENSFELCYSATAFHWLPQEQALAKVLRELKPGGALAIFRNYPFVRRESDPTNLASSSVYEAFRPTNKTFTERSEADAQPFLTALRQVGFADVQLRLYRRVRTLPTEPYIGLLNTYSDHRALEAETRAAFEKAMREALERVGGVVNIYDTVELFLARKAQK